MTKQTKLKVAVQTETKNIMLTNIHENVAIKHLNNQTGSISE